MRRLRPGPSAAGHRASGRRRGGSPGAAAKLLGVVLLAIPFGLLIGLIVGSIGGGGAILALPVLVYVLGQPAGPASTAALVVVAIAATAGALRPAYERLVCWRIALRFAGPAALAALGGALLNAQVGGRTVVLAFIPVMLLAAVATWHRAGETDADEPDGGCPDVELRRIVLAAAAVGGMTGFFGVGGGFAIVPLLTLWLGLSFRRAVATSLVIITLTGLAALASHLAAGSGVGDLAITASLAAATAVGAITGSAIGSRLPQATLGRAFALVVACVAALLFVDVVFHGGPPGA